MVRTLKLKPWGKIMRRRATQWRGKRGPGAGPPMKTWGGGAECVLVPLVGQLGQCRPINIGHIFFLRFDDSVHTQVCPPPQLTIASHASATQT